MAIHDLLWACPACGTEGGLRPWRGGETCTACGRRYRQLGGGRIVAEGAGEPEVTREAGEWAARLPEVRGVPAGEAMEAAVQLRRAVGDQVVKVAGEYLGRVERFGPPVPGTLRLTADALGFMPESGGEELAWGLEELTAVQLSSGSLQLKFRRKPLASFRFRDSSPRLWEARLGATLRALYARRGWGEVREMQPRIAVRPGSATPGPESAGDA